MRDKRTKIVCTMGPATEDDEVLRALIEGGMNVARFNFSHGSHDYHGRNMERVRSISDELGIPVAILLDTKGPEIRTGVLQGGRPVTLVAGEEVVVSADGGVGDAHHIVIDYAGLPSELEKGSVILIDDGLIGLEVLSSDADKIRCVVTNGGELGERKGINLPGVETGLPALSDQDRLDLRFGCEQKVDAISASFIRNAAGVDEIRGLCSEFGLDDVAIFPKIECALGIRNFDEILEVSDGIMVARGDLGVEVPPEQVPFLQKSMIEKCNRARKPVITATQMLDSMIRNPRPTRAEVTDVANAIYDGTDCVMLSGETAAGRYPVSALRMMASICRETESHLPGRRETSGQEYDDDISVAIGSAAVQTALRVGARCIIAPTATGRTARLISNLRPELPVIALSASENTIRRCCWYWGIEAYRGEERTTLSQDIDDAMRVSCERGYASAGDLVVITAGDAATSPTSNGDQVSTNLVLVAQIR